MAKATKNAAGAKAPSKEASAPVAASPFPVSTSAMKAITHEMIAARARQIWEKKGRPSGQDEQNWREAEAELRAAASGR